MPDSANTQAKSLWLMDGSIYFFRGYFGIPESVVDSRGRSVNGVLGFAQALLSISGGYCAAGSALGIEGGCAVAFDESLGTGFRHRLYAPYKANRALPDAQIRRQFRECRALCQCLGIPCWASSEFEADDLLATLSCRSRLPTMIYSKDKDLHQLISEKTSVRDVQSGTYWDSRAARKHYGFSPALLPDYQALVGDASDNVPGVPGVGAKTATRLVTRYGSLEQVLRSVPSWVSHGIRLPPSGRVATGLAEYGERAIQMRELLRLKTSVPLPVGATRRADIDSYSLSRWLKRTGLNRRLGRALRANGVRTNA